MSSDILCITGADDPHLETKAYGPFASRQGAREFAETLSTDPDGDVDIVELDRSALWWPVHKRGHQHIEASANPSCPYCREER